MRQLTAENALAYLADAGWTGAESFSITPLGGGVSNTVLLAERLGDRLVLKQALAKLRVAADWRSQPERTLREADAMRELAPLLPPGALPAIRHIDRTNCIYIMNAAPSGAEDWKAHLLEGDADPRVASATGRILGALFRASHDQPRFRAAFGDQTVFDELRLDPYYRYTAAAHPQAAAFFNERIADCRERAVSLVHGDWSPKNLLVDPTGGVMAIDFEVIHFGDPCFDTGFLLNHLVLKSIHRPQDAPKFSRCAEAFLSALSIDEPWLLPGTIAHMTALLLARVDGKSPAEYLYPSGRETARRLALGWVASPPANLKEIWQCL